MPLSSYIKIQAFCIDFIQPSLPVLVTNTPFYISQLRKAQPWGEKLGFSFACG